MPGDYTRFTFNPAKGFSGLRKQQGRVSLDSDWNEYEEILDRRSRATMYDLAGPAVVPVTTPLGFKIGVNSAGKLTIGVGRTYVDGIQVECFGDLTTTDRDDHLGGVLGNAPLVFDRQPFFYDTPSFPTLSPNAGTINLVYLDVWQREVTVWEDDALREPALNGPDTATRVQTAWQVKVLPDADASSCATPPAAWTALTAPSTARLSTQAVPTVPAVGPCIINPVGGYTGLENRLYRVEIHRAGTLAGANNTQPAQFKWSRDNASLAARVLSITSFSGNQSVITVSSTGRDAWMRFEQGHHIELLDDAVELSRRETGVSGTMAEVVSVNHATGEIKVKPDLSAFGVVAGRHPRIVRWDTATPTELLVRDTNNGVALALEEGITITFGGAPTDTLHAGDYWVFAARTADGTIDTLVDAPPRGILHHFERLALVTSGAPPTLLSDCRHLWPSCCCCTIEVGDGTSSHGEFDDIAAALRAATERTPAGGPIRLCLLPGNHRLSDTVMIQRDSVTISGCCRRTVISCRSNDTIFDLRGSALRLECLSLTWGGRRFSGPLVRLSGCQDAEIEDNLFNHPYGPMILCDNPSRPRIVGNRFEGPEAILAHGDNLLIARNQFLGQGAVQLTQARGLIDLRAGTSTARVDDNRLDSGPGHGITLTPTSLDGTNGYLNDIVITGNEITGMAGSGIATSFFADVIGQVSPQFPAGTAPLYIYGLRIERNLIESCVTQNTWTRTDGAPQAGIAIGGVDQLRIAHNRIADNGRYLSDSIAVAGIYIGRCLGLILSDNVVYRNGRDGGPVRGNEGGIVALDLGFSLEVLWVWIDLGPFVGGLFLPFFRPDGWPAALVQNNLVVAPSGRALTARGWGEMQVTDNRLLARQLVPIAGSELTAYTGAVLIETSPSPFSIQSDSVFLATTWLGIPPNGDGNVIFSDNDVTLDQVLVGQRDPSGVLLYSVVLIVASDDLAFHDNVIRCQSGVQNLIANTFLKGATTRATGNGIFEDGFLDPFNTLYVSARKAYDLCTVTGNQTTHCIMIDAVSGARVVNTNNLAAYCSQFIRLILDPFLTQLESDRRSLQVRTAASTGTAVAALTLQKTALSKTATTEVPSQPVDPRQQPMENRLAAAAGLKEAFEVDLRMSDRAKEIQPGDWALLGRLLDREGRPLAGGRLELLEADKHLTEITADENGEIFAHFAQEKFADIFKRAPELKVNIKGADGTVLQTLEQTLTPVADQVVRFELRVGMPTDLGGPRPSPQVAASELQASPEASTAPPPEPPPPPAVPSVEMPPSAPAPAAPTVPATSADVQGPPSPPAPTPAPPVSPAPPSTPATPAPAPTLADVRGIGPVALSRLQAAGITRPSEVAAMEPARLAGILQMPEARVQNIIDSARQLTAEKPAAP